MAQQRAMIGMSGGVDSSVAAYLMKQAGCTCVGATMRLWDKDPSAPVSSDAHDAQLVAQRLGIEHHIFDYRDIFRDRVVRPFIDSYESGLTPNPCIRCNRTLKFGTMLDTALSLGCEYVVTGHYAQIRRDSETGRYLLCRAADQSKDQTYFLYGLSQFQLSHTKFPLGTLAKNDARDIAEANGLVTARKRDSQDICFIPDGDYAAFLERYQNKQYPSGSFLDLQGNVVGQHRGAPCYTIGQRKGLGLAMGAPVYVCGKDMACNTVTVGPNEVLFHNALLARDMNWICVESLREPASVTARIRHSLSEYQATVYPLEDGMARVEFAAPLRAITPGQAVVLYRGDTVLGGGTIVKPLDV